MFTKKNILKHRCLNRFLIRNGDHIGIYKYIDGWMVLKTLLTKEPKTCKDSKGYDIVYKVYDSYEDKVNNTLLKYTIHEPTNTIQDLVMVSEIYPLYMFVNTKLEYDMEAIKYAIYNDGDFQQTLLDILVSKTIII